jgi:hypothetical protein
LAGIYRVASKTTVNDATLKTVGDLFKKIEAAVASELPAGSMPKVRRAYGDFLNQAVGTTPTTPLDDATRAKAADAFAKVAAALGGVK